MAQRSSKHASITALRKSRVSRMARRAVFTAKRPNVFKVRKSLVDYVDEELQEMETSVFYQRVFIFAKNVDLEAVEAEKAAALAVTEKETTETEKSNASATASLVEAEGSGGEEEEHYSRPTTPDTPHGPVVRIFAPGEGEEKETVTHTFDFAKIDDDDAARSDGAENVAMELEPEPEPVKKRDFYDIFLEKLQDVQRKCQRMCLTPDPMCGLFLYMGEYTLLMLESGEDMMCLFCEELLEMSQDYWQSNRIFMIEDYIKEAKPSQLELSFPSESLIGEEGFEEAMVESSGDDESTEAPVATKRTLSTMSASLPAEVFRKLLPEIQRIELVLASTRFYYTLKEFVDLYGKMPFAADDDGLYWPVPNNYTPANIFRRTPYDINLTFADYAAEMNRRLQEEQDKHKAELEAAEEAEAHAAAEQAQASAPRERAAKPDSEHE
ncbi:CG15878 [Drosophila busckii]|uniref:CG15878 n=1 Tax=Drosophila busckii TaxID=30019 RepID=A0A0M4EXU7_DROBS|nr:CG15878 [Drosophila busckii]